MTERASDQAARERAIQTPGSVLVQAPAGSGKTTVLAERCAFLERYTAAVAKAYPRVADGSVLLPFPRVFLTAIR